MTRRNIAAIATALSFCGVVVIGQGRTESRNILFSAQPIVEVLRPTDRHVVIATTTTGGHADLGGRSLAEVIAEHNPIILVGQVVRKQPEFLYKENLAADPIVVPMASANWIGSRLTVLVEQVIQTVDELPLIDGDRLTFVHDGEGSAIINGTRVDSANFSLWPIEEGKRYLVLGRFENDWFGLNGMWLEPSPGAPLRSPNRRGEQDLRLGVLSEFESMSLVVVAYRLEQEVAKRRARAPR